MTIEILKSPTSRYQVAQLARDSFGEMIKGVVDVSRRVIALGGELHSDEESALLDDGSVQNDLWGINLYPAESGENWIEFDSMINIRPALNNRSRDVEDENLRERIREVVTKLIPE
ncbi:MAG TPA: DUF5674 family protein [Gemmatimonadaceae bacterium]|nr:DUF5674 family protein [Gemmatimonadaceae bacterium]